MSFNSAMMSISTQICSPNSSRKKIQGDHPPRKSGKVRKFDDGQEKSSKLGKFREKSAKL